MTASLGRLIVDADDVAAVRGFWETALGPDACARLLEVVPQERPKVVKNRVHLDVYVRDVDVLLAMGARVLDAYPPLRATLVDVEGNEFCAFVDPDLGGDFPARAFAVCTDSERPAAIAAWWAPRVGARIGPGPDGTPRYLHGCAGWPELVWKFVPVPDARVTPNRWRWSVRGGTFDGPVDPDGNEFVQRG